MSQLNSVRNPDGIWINTAMFREAAINFDKYGYYCSFPDNSPDWIDYWSEERRRCREGYSVGGVKITGNHYFYLNYCRIEVVEDKGGKQGVKRKKFPDFWDGDYNYFWALEIAENGVANETSLILSATEKDVINALDEAKRKQAMIDAVKGLNLSVKIFEDDLEGAKHMIVGKSRRKGYSYKNGAICANIYNTQPNSITIIGAFEKKYLYPEGTMGMASNYINFLNEHTAWVMPRDVVDKQEHRKASYITTRDGVKIEKGYKSQIMAVTFKDKPDAARGKDARKVLMEEAGAFPNLKDSYNATFPGLTAGKYITGQIIIFGTGGDMEGGTADFADMFYRPGAFNLMRFENIWDEDSEGGRCGFFHPVNWNLEGFYDEQGNSDEEGAKAAELATRKNIIDNGGTSTEIQKRVQEYPIGPAEAFLTVNTNNFPVIELRKQLEIVKAKGWQLTKGTPVKMYYDSIEQKVKADPILDGTANPIYKLKPDNLSLEGCPVIYEYPAITPVPGAYKIGFDPYRQERGTSLAAIYVYKSVIRGSYTKQIIVAEYVGRPDSADDVNYIAMLFAELYNTKIMHENEVTQVKDYFRRRNQLKYLAYQPDEVIKANTKNSRVNRTYGCHMNDKMKDAGEKYIKQWLTDVIDYDEQGNPIRPIDKIYSIGLLEELIAYNRKGNFDRVMALMQVMFQDQQDMLGTEYKEEHKPNKSAEKLVKMIPNMYKKNSNRSRGSFI